MGPPQCLDSLHLGPHLEPQSWDKPISALHGDPGAQVLDGSSSRGGARGPLPTAAQRPAMLRVPLPSVGPRLGLQSPHSVALVFCRGGPQRLPLCPALLTGVHSAPTTGLRAPGPSRGSQMAEGDPVPAGFPFTAQGLPQPHLPLALPTSRWEPTHLS